MKMNAVVLLIGTLLSSFALAYSNLPVSPNRPAPSYYPPYQDSSGRIVLGDRIENLGNGWCTLYRLYRYQDGSVVEHLVAGIPCQR